MIPDRLRALITRRIRYRLTSGGTIFFLALALTGMIAFVSGNNLLFLIFAAMLALLLVSGFLSRLVLAGLEIELLLPAHVAARMPSAARIRIRNLKRFTPSFSIGVSGCPDSSGGEPIFNDTLYFPLIPGGAMREAETSVLFPRRGSHRENVFALATAFPFGFLHKTVRVALRRETVVYPAMTAGLGIEELADSLAGDASSTMRGGGRDFYRIRPYEADDSARHVDWKSTAHTGSLQVREFLRDRDKTIEVVFDRYILPGAEPAFEKLIESCAFLLWYLANEDVECAFRSGDFYQALEDSLAVYDVLRFLALVEPLVESGAPLLADENDESRRQVLFTIRGKTVTSDS